MTDPSHPIDSATVLVLRDAGRECEVLLVQRHADSRAFGGAHVFPGGMIDAADSAPTTQAASSLTAAAAAARLGEARTPEAALAFWIGAIRELFEETGVLLAAVDGTALRLDDPVVGPRFVDHRHALLGGTATLADVVARERLALATANLAYWSRWITPENVPRRYDARFFVTRVPTGQEPLHDQRETVATVWRTPHAAIDEAHAGTIQLAPPTLRTLEELAALGTVERILAAADTRVVTPILPKPVSVGGRMAILFPGDADYDHVAAGDALPAAPSGRRDRVVHENGRWRTLRD